MQTHLPVPDNLKANMRVLTRQQLGGQVNETDQVLTTIERNLDNWIARHPVTRAWANHYAALVLYGVYAYREWKGRWRRNERGGQPKHKSGERILDRWAAIDCPVVVDWPAWYGDPRLTANHRGRLVDKFPEYYGQLWDIAPVKENWYPVRDGGYEVKE